jgi:hypothetical protein
MNDAKLSVFSMGKQNYKFSHLAHIPLGKFSVRKIRMHHLSSNRVLVKCVWTSDNAFLSDLRPALDSVNRQFC